MPEYISVRSPLARRSLARRSRYTRLTAVELMNALADAAAQGHDDTADLLAALMIPARGPFDSEADES